MTQHLDEPHSIAFIIFNVISGDKPDTWLEASILFSLRVASRLFITKEAYLSNSEIFFPLDHNLL